MKWWRFLMPSILALFWSLHDIPVKAFWRYHCQCSDAYCLELFGNSWLNLLFRLGRVPWQAFTGVSAYYAFSPSRDSTHLLNREHMIILIATLSTPTPSDYVGWFLALRYFLRHSSKAVWAIWRSTRYQKFNNCPIIVLVQVIVCETPCWPCWYVTQWSQCQISNTAASPHHRLQQASSHSIPTPHSMIFALVWTMRTAL